LLVPTHAGGGSVDSQSVVQTISNYPNSRSVINGAPVFVDNPVKASLRGDTYDDQNYIVYADASSEATVADAIAFKQGKSLLLYRTGVVDIDLRVVEGGVLSPGEYYYLSQPQSGIPYGQMTSNKPTFGVVQLLGQAINERQIYVNTNTEPVTLGKTALQWQGSLGSVSAIPTSKKGEEGDIMGDVTYDASYMYLCVKDYDGVSDIWIRTLIDDTKSKARDLFPVILKKVRLRLILLMVLFTQRIKTTKSYHSVDQVDLVVVRLLTFILIS